MRKIEVCLQDSVTDNEVEMLIKWLQGVRCTGAVYEVIGDAAQQSRALDAANRTAFKGSGSGDGALSSPCQ